MSVYQCYVDNQVEGSCVDSTIVPHGKQLRLGKTIPCSIFGWVEAVGPNQWEEKKENGEQANSVVGHDDGEYTDDRYPWFTEENQGYPILDGKSL